MKKKRNYREKKHTACRTGNRIVGKSNGFTLIETLVAMMILAVSFVVIMQLFSGGLKTGRLSDDYTRAIFHAREKMEEILLTEKPGDISTEGEFEDGFKWKAKITGIERAQEEKGKIPVDNFNVKVEITWLEGSREKHFEISTLKIAEAEKSES